MWLLLALLGGAEAGPWTRTLGEAYVRFGADGYLTSRYVVPGTQLDVSTEQYVGVQAGPYAEVGLAEAWPVQLALSAPLGWHRARFSRADVFETVSGHATVVRPGDLRLRPQVALHRELPLAVAVEAKVPLYRNGSVCEGEVFQAECPLPGDGQVDLTALLLAGAGTGWGWVEGAVGWRHRTEWFVGWEPGLELVDGIVFEGKVGVEVGPVRPMVELEGVVVPRPDPITPEAVRAGVAAMVDVADGVAIEARLRQDLWGSATSIGTGAGLGVSWRTP